jgi:ferredoxin
MSVRDKVFVKKSRRGNVVLAAREHYLRDDLACGALACAKCPVRLSRPSSSVAIAGLPLRAAGVLSAPLACS